MFDFRPRSEPFLATLGGIFRRHVLRSTLVGGLFGVGAHGGYAALTTFLLTTNDGGIAVKWAPDGHGILLRAEWDIERYLQDGRLVQVLSHCSMPDADIDAIYPQRHRLAARVRAVVDFTAPSFATLQNSAWKRARASDAISRFAS